MKTPEQKAQIAEYNRRYRAAHPEYFRRYYAHNRERLLKHMREYSLENKERLKEKRRKYEAARLPERAAYVRRRYSLNPNARLQSQINAQTNLTIRTGWKFGFLKLYLGCSVAEFKAHIEKQFLPGWSWENRGKVWQVDHIFPRSAVVVGDTAALARCCHYSNMRPLATEKNLEKRQQDKTISQPEPTAELW